MTIDKTLTDSINQVSRVLYNLHRVLRHRSWRVFIAGVKNHPVRLLTTIKIVTKAPTVTIKHSSLFMFSSLFGFHKILFSNIFEKKTGLKTIRVRTDVFKILPI